MRSALTPLASTAIVSVSRGGRGTSRPRRLRRRRTASTDESARSPRLTSTGKQARITRARRLGEFDCMALEAALAPRDLGTACWQFGGQLAFLPNPKAAVPQEWARAQGVRGYGWLRCPFNKETGASRPLPEREQERPRLSATRLRRPRPKWP